MKRRSAFTLIELLVVIAIIALLAWIVAWCIPGIYASEPEYGPAPDKDEVGACRDKCKGIRQYFFRVLVYAMLLWLPLRLCETLLPSTKEMAIIYVVPKVVSSEVVSQIPKKLLLLSSEWIEESRPENIKESGKTIVQHAK